LECSFDLTNLTFTVGVPAGRFTDFTVGAVAPEVGWATVVPLGSTRAAVTLTARPGQVLRGPKQFAELCFALVSNQPSAFVQMEVQDILGLRESGMPIGNDSGTPGRTVVVVGEHPLLNCVRGAGGKPALLLYARPGWSCIIEERASAHPGDTWRGVKRVTTTELVTTLSLEGTNSQAFYGAVRSGAREPRLSLQSVNGSVYRFKVDGGSVSRYSIETATNVLLPLLWRAAFDLTLTNGWSVFDWANAGEPARFFRGVRP
jgi:hypothetical protein